MKIRLFAVLILSSLFSASLEAQNNEFINNPVAEQILLGNYDPELYLPSEIISGEQEIINGLISEVSRENLADLLVFLDTFYNRNTGSDTTSLDTGIGACREWILSYFNLLSRQNENRLITGYLEFDADVCGMGHHKNPFAILPGSDTSHHEILVIEGHFDTRNEDGCDTEGYTPGSDDNGSGTVLIMEAARVMSKYSFERTILFTTPTGEDQGLWGAKAWANYLSDKGIKVKACLNNDVVGGITCGKTSSPPSCPYEGHIDSTHVRVFSFSSGNTYRSYSPHKQLARLIKYLQEEKINPLSSTQMFINIMATEDRTGRSGDHIPFRQKGYPAIRFCSANEHGNGKGDYPDRQHSERDVFGVDEDGDGILDSLYVDPGYLKRNTLINCVTLAHLASSANQKEFSFYPVESGVRIEVNEAEAAADSYMVGVRYYASKSHEFDEIKVVAAADDFVITIDPSSRAYISVCAVKDGFCGMFSEEYDLNLTSVDPFESANSCRIENVFPNPAGNILNIEINTGLAAESSYVLQITDFNGRVLKNKEITTGWGQNSYSLQIDDLSPGIYLALISDRISSSRPHKFLKYSNQ